MQDRIQAQKAGSGSSNLLELSREEFEKLKEAIEQGKNKLTF